MSDQTKFNGIPQSDNYLNAWGWKRIVAAVASGGASEAMAAITNRNPENGQRETVGGKKWTKREAVKYMKDAGPMVTYIEDVTSRIVGTAPENVKENHKDDWARLLSAAVDRQEKVKIAWKGMNDASNAVGGWDSESNRKTANENFQKIDDMHQWARKADDSRHIWSTVRDIDKAVQAFKTVNLAAGRIPFITLLKLNAFGIATSMASQRRNDPEAFKKVEYTWKQLGGNRTEFGKAITKGAKKKPFPLKKNSSGFDGYKYASSASDADSAKQVTPEGEAKVNEKGAEKLNEVLKVAPGGVAAILQVLINTPVTAWGAAGVAAGTAVSALAIKYVKAKADPQGGSDFKEAGTEFSDADVQNLKETDPDTRGTWIRNVPNWATATGGLTLLGLATWGVVVLVKNSKK